MRWIYSLLYTTGFLVALPYFLIVGLIRGKYLRTFKQRFGAAPDFKSQNVCWIHAVSVGEFLAAKPLLRRLQEEFPEMRLAVSTTTITGQRLAQEQFPGASFYFPFDWAWCIRRVFRQINPKLILILETEIWPNFLWEANHMGIPVVLLNGRISDQSFRRYSLFRKFFPQFARCLMQSGKDAERITALGAQDARVMGNMKFDFRPPSLPDSLERLILSWKQQSLLWIAGSTMKGEESVLLDVFRRLRLDLPLKLMIAPRHPERFQEVADLVRRAEIPYSLRSNGEPGDSEILILDTIGELAACYQWADVVFVGGTLLEGSGGHNPIEPAFFAKSIVTGPYYLNFRNVFEEFKKREAIVIARDPAPAVHKLLNDPELRFRIGTEANKLVMENAGATEVALQSVREFWNAGRTLEPGSQLLVR